MPLDRQRRNGYRVFYKALEHILLIQTNVSMVLECDIFRDLVRKAAVWGS